jgi:hypothetical protein
MLRIIALSLLLIGPALAQDGVPRPAPTKRAWITEFSTNRVEAAAPIATLPSLRKQPALDLSDGLPKYFLKTTSSTRYVRVMCEIQCAISSTGAASVNDIVLPLLHAEYFLVNGVQTISVIAAP